MDMVVSIQMVDGEACLFQGVNLGKQLIPDLFLQACGGVFLKQFQSGPFTMKFPLGIGQVSMRFEECPPF
jgi:hypothetical protein